MLSVPALLTPVTAPPPCRWVSSILIHTSFQHVLSNMLLFVVLGWQIEEKYGALRLAFIFFWSAIGGQPWCHLCAHYITSCYITKYHITLHDITLHHIILHYIRPLATLMIKINMSDLVNDLECLVMTVGRVSC